MTPFGSVWRRPDLWWGALAASVVIAVLPGCAIAPSGGYHERPSLKDSNRLRKARAAKKNRRDAHKRAFRRKSRKSIARTKKDIAAKQRMALAVPRPKPLMRPPLPNKRPRFGMKSIQAAPTVQPIENDTKKVVAKPSPAAAKLITEGYRFFKAGFVSKARQSFIGAIDDKAPPATLGYARTLDPNYLKDLPQPDEEPDIDRARRLYQRAIELGSTEAQVDLERLEALPSLNK